MNNIIIIGGGASSLMLASLLPKNSVTILESNNKLGAKMLISGGGKCNITNSVMSAEYYLGDSSFIRPSLKKFNEKSILKWLERQGLEPELRKDSQYFCKDSAKEIVDIFKYQSSKQDIHLNEVVKSVQKEHSNFIVTTNKNKYKSKAVVVASGGLSYEKLGASSIGYDIATSFGHNIIKTAPALVGFTVQKNQFFFKELSGVSTDVVITVNDVKCKGSLLFTHKGISGPSVLDASLYWEKGLIDIDFFPDFNFNSLVGKKLISSILPLPKRVIKEFLKIFNIEDKPAFKLTKDELLCLKSLNQYSFSPAGTFGYSKAEVTKGGVDTQEIHESTMMSKLVPNLYFIGEVLNVTGRLGGYNFQWAFSSAYSCSKSIKKII